MKSKKEEELEGKNGLSDKDFRDAHFDDKLFLFWNKYQNAIWTLVTIIMLGVIAFQGLKLFREYQKSQMQEAFTQALTSNNLESFAQNNSDKELGGYAFLVLADKAFSEKKYAEAEQYYLNSLNGLKDSEINGRAQLGRAMCLVFENKEGATNSLSMIADNDKILLPIRLEALTNLCVYNIEKKDFTSYETNIEKLRILATGTNAYWLSRVEGLAQSVPELSK